MCNDYEFYFMVASTGMFFYSEAMPFLKKHKGNGFFHALYLVLHSDCVKPRKDAEAEEDNVV